MAIEKEKNPAGLGSLFSWDKEQRMNSAVDRDKRQWGIPGLPTRPTVLAAGLGSYHDRPNSQDDSLHYQKFHPIHSLIDLGTEQTST